MMTRLTQWRQRRRFTFYIRAVLTITTVGVVLLIHALQPDVSQTPSKQRRDIHYKNRATPNNVSPLLQSDNIKKPNDAIKHEIQSIKEAPNPSTYDQSAEVNVLISATKNQEGAVLSDHNESRLRWFSGSRRHLFSLNEVYLKANASVGDAAWRVNLLPKDAPPSNESEQEQEHHLYVCTEPAYLEFPQDVFTQAQRRAGAMALHVMMICYMFLALAVVCDVYFVSSLEKICERLNLSEDVAGATFMAAGSSAPELFTSIIGVFIAKGDVGVGTIVGSAVFNILFVIGICGLLVSQVVMLTWFPLVRDSLFYSVSVIMLIAFISDSRVSVWEALVMVLVYALYIVFMKYNVSIQDWAMARVKVFGEPEEDLTTILTPGAKVRYYSSSDYEPFHNEHETNKSSKEHIELKRKQAPLNVDQLTAQPKHKLSFSDACLHVMLSKEFRPVTRFAAAARIIITERQRMPSNTMLLNQKHSKDYNYDDDTLSNCKAEVNSDIDKEEASPRDQWKRIPSSSEGLLPVLKWVMLTPIQVCLYYTVPDCSHKRWESWYMCTFCMSIVWIAVFSYLMVWMVAIIGYTLGIPDSIMGITFLAAGTSVPDAMASVMVARLGQGDMAVSNTIGSNVFDICICLGLPWLIKTGIVSPGSKTSINSNGMVFSVILLFLTVVVTVGSIHFNGWKLDRRLGIVCLCCYAVFLVFSCMIEFNVFGYVNPPMCPHHD